MGKKVDALNHRYGRYVVIAEVGMNKWGSQQVWVLCDCGTKRIVQLSSLRGGKSQSCGCLAREKASVTMRMSKLTHGMRRKSIYNIWCNMRSRCNNPNNPNYERYGGRGIKVCERWMKFENFYLDMGDRPKGLSIDRIDNNKGYEPGNCKWATPKDQARNTRQTRTINTPDGPMLAVEAAEKYGISIDNIRSRIHRGWPEERLLEPIKRR